MKDINIKDNLIDAWYTEPSGRERTVEIEVPDEVVQSGTDSIEEHVYAYLDSLAPNSSDLGFSQTW